MSDEWDKAKLKAEVNTLRADLAALREFIEDLRMQAVHAVSAELMLSNEYIIDRCDAALKGDDHD